MKRSRVEIIIDILKVASNGARKTEIMYGANLSYSALKKYLDFMCSCGLLRSDGKIYRITKKGRDVLVTWERLRETLTLSSRR